MQVIVCLNKKFCFKSIVNYYNNNSRIEQKETQEIY